MNMVELIERMEKATGPDRELDRAIFAALNPTRTEYCYENGKHCIHSMPCQTPHYSRSIDAALTLVPEGSTSFLLAYLEKRTPPCGAHVGPSLDARADASTPALALCIAALKAHAALSEPERVKE